VRWEQKERDEEGEEGEETEEIQSQVWGKEKQSEAIIQSNFL